MITLSTHESSSSAADLKPQLSDAANTCMHQHGASSTRDTGHADLALAYDSAFACDAAPDLVLRAERGCWWIIQRTKASKGGKGKGGDGLTAWVETAKVMSKSLHSIGSKAASVTASIRARSAAVR